MLWASSLVLVAQLDRALRLDCLAWAIMDVTMRGVESWKS